VEKTVREKSSRRPSRLNARTARILWLMADMETDKGKAFWKEAERGK
jgi:hypothetical protein